LIYDGFEGFDYVALAVAEVVAGEFVRDVTHQFGEKGYFEEFVECDEFEVCGAIGAECWWWRPVGQGAVAVFLDLEDGFLGGVWEAVY